MENIRKEERGVALVRNDMKILCPITTSDDIEILNPQKYNTEFYCGYMPEWWEDLFNNNNTSNSVSSPINNRNNKTSNVRSKEELERIVNGSRKYNTDTFLAINAKYYPNYIYPYLERYLGEIYDLGIRKAIVCDLGMISLINKKYPEMKVSVSCLNQVTNSYAVDFYLQFDNVERIVFPRHMSIKEIIEIADHFPNVDFEYFIFSNKCIYDDGYCRGLHEFTPICKDLFYDNYYGVNGSVLNDQTIKHLQAEGLVYREWTRHDNYMKNKGYCTRSFACTACSLRDLSHKENIVSVKLSIRGHDVTERLRQVKMARSAIEAEKTGDIEKIKKTVSTLFGKDDLCDCQTACMMI